jgi:hypothetical protein
MHDDPDAPYFYRLGTAITAMPAPLIPGNCLEIPAGPLLFVLESRFLADDLVTLKLDEGPDAALVDDGGASVHVFGTADGLEHLRFDCFDRYPHYHYVDNANQVNRIVRLDEIALGDPMEWVIGRLRRRLPEMLDYVGVADLAEAVRADMSSVLAAVDVVSAKLSGINDRARDRRMAARADSTVAQISG